MKIMTKLAKSFSKTFLTGEKTKNLIAESISRKIKTDPKRLYELTTIASSLGILDKIYLTVPDGEFNRIKGMLKPSDPSHSQHFDISIDNTSYSIMIYCEDSDNYTMHIDEAVKRVLEKWVNIRFSEEQKKELKQMLDYVHHHMHQQEVLDRMDNHWDNDTEPDFYTHKY